MAFKWLKKKSNHKQVDEIPSTQKKDGIPGSLEMSTPKAVSSGSPRSPADRIKNNDKTETLDESPERYGNGEKEPDKFPSPAESKQKKKTEKSVGLFSRLKNGLSKTRKILTTNIDELFDGTRGIDENMLEELEELLITADIGVKTTMEIIQRISKNAPHIINAEDLKERLKDELLTLLPANHPDDNILDAKPHVVMVVGVNGVGKTTTIGKLAAKAVSGNKKVLIAAADTFRAAGIEQIAIWADRAGAEIVKHKANADPAAVAFDAIAAAVARNVDVVFIDTAGRLHTKTNLMEELKKIKRTISKKLPGAPHEILLVLDATTGQNGISQATLFKEDLGVTGIVLTKLDGTAKGGIVVSICNTLNIPLTHVGVGETIDDLQPFDSVEFVKALL